MPLHLIQCYWLGVAISTPLISYLATPAQHLHHKGPVQVLYRHGRLMMYRNQGMIRQDSQEDGIFVVISGLVRVTYNAVDEDPQEYFLGTGRHMT